MADPGKRDPYKHTLNLPKTDFPLRAELAKREPDRVAWWRERDTYRKRLARNRGNVPYVLHDGPPYANGDLHMGTFLNRVLKDAFVKVALLDGRYADFVPGWDMHGLPIERETLKHLGLDFRAVDPLELRRACRERALYWLDRQRSQMIRMGEFARWDEPYMTIAPTFEATIVETLADLAERDELYKGLRATLWCATDETALAEAEIEYRDKVSDSIYVRFGTTPAQRDALLAAFGAAGDLAALPLSVVIWTTTPWTLPANVAVALKGDADYGLYPVRGADGRVREHLIVATALAAAVAARVAAGEPGLTMEPAPVATARGAALERLTLRHPFLDRDALLVVADYVELDTGTGAVHTAPGHGEDDFRTGLAYGLPVLTPVDGAGRFTAEAGPYAGLGIFAANPQIIADLRAAGALVAAESYEHSYPHCWRCKQPVVYRATAQWFIGMDRHGLREQAAAAIRDVRWTPAWGEGRMAGMIEHHPEWCVSRQRVWGTPIPSLVCRACGEAFLDPAFARNFAAAMRARPFSAGNASDLWWTEPVEAFAPPGLACPRCGGTTFEKERNIVDIWFESGVTWRAVLVERGMAFPADTYLEGGDQYRGWFRSNLVTAVATRGTAPYREVVAHGWVVDERGHAMHKSAGNYVEAVAAIDTYGADVLRLWVASIEYTQDARLGAKLLENVQNVYKNLRFRLRYLLSNLYDLAPEHLVPRERLEPLDRLVLARLDATAREVVAAYREHRLHDAYVALIAFDDELSSFWLDAVKDRLYSLAAGDPARRSAQVATFELLRALCVMLAPVLSFTAEEAWQHVPAALRGDAESVFDLELPRVAALDEAALADWALLRELRARVAGATGERDVQLDAVVVAPPATARHLRTFGDNLREALIVSTLRGIEDGEAVEVRTLPAPPTRCERCRRYLELGTDPEHPDLCARCAAVVTALEPLG